MSEHAIGRRQMVRTAAGVAAGGVLVAGAGVGAAAADDSGHGLLGSWWVTHENDAPAEPEPGVTVVSFVPGGALITNDIMPAGGISSGSWAATDNNRFRATFWGGLPPESGVENGTVRVQVRGRMHDGMISGTFTVTGFDGDEVEMFSATGTFEGTRLKA